MSPKWKASRLGDERSKAGWSTQRRILDLVFKILRLSGLRSLPIESLQHLSTCQLSGPFLTSAVVIFQLPLHLRVDLRFMIVIVRKGMPC